VRFDPDFDSDLDPGEAGSKLDWMFSRMRFHLRARGASVNDRGRLDSGVGVPPSGGESGLKGWVEALNSDGMALKVAGGLWSVGGG